MKNNLNIIQQDINQLTENQKRVFLEKEHQKQIKEFKERCKELIQNKLIDALERNNYNFYQVLRDKYIIVGRLIDEISDETIKKEIQKGTTREEFCKTGANFKTITTYEKRFNYDDEFINEILTNLFDAELSKIEREHHKKEKYQKEYLKAKLKDAIINTIEENKDDNITYHQLIRIIGEEDSKGEIINEISDDENDIAILNAIYTPTLNEINREYKWTIEQEKERERFKKAQSKQIKVPTPFKILGAWKGVETLFKL